MHIEEASEFSDDLLSALRALATELVPSARPVTRDHVRETLSCPCCRLFVANGPANEVVGMAVLASYPIPTGRHYWIEDVIVAQQARGQGIGEALVRRALDAAREDGAEFVDLTSRPTREAARRLYARIGFEQRETTVYRYRLHPSS